MWVCGKHIVTHEEGPRLAFVSAVQACLFRGYNANYLFCWKNGSVFPFFDVAMQSPLLGWGTVQSCLIRHNNAEISVRIGNRASCLFRYKKTEFSVSDGERFSLVPFDITIQSAMLAWDTVQSCLFWCKNAEFVMGVVNGFVFLVFCGVTMQSSLLGWGTIQSCLFRYNNAEFSVGMENGSVLSFSI